MKQKISYLFAAVIIYFIAGLLVSYFAYSMIDWKFVIMWALFMSIFDYLIIRNMKKWFSRKNKAI